MFDFDTLQLDGYPLLSPFAIADGVDMSPGKKRMSYVDSPDADGAVPVEPPRRDNLERVIPLEIYRRFTSAITNLATNPSFKNDVTAAAGLLAAAVAHDTTDGKDSTSCAKVTTPATANAGVEISFIATAVAHSAGIWVNAPAGAPMAILFDGGTQQAFTGDGAWQLVKLENKTLTAATRKLQVVQTDATARVFRVDAIVITATSTTQYLFHGDCGDAKWNGTPHASTSTTLTGEAATAYASGVLTQRINRAEALAHLGGVPLRLTLPGVSWPVTTDAVGGEITDRLIDLTHVLGMATLKLTIVSKPKAYGPELLAGSYAKAAGAPGAEWVVGGILGDEAAPARIVFRNPNAYYHQRFLAWGIQSRTFDTNTNLIIRASAMGTASYPGTVATAAVNEVQSLFATGAPPTGGAFGVVLDGQASSASALPHNATAIQVQAVIEALPNVGAGNVVCTGGPLTGSSITVTFVGKLAGCDMSLMSLNTTNLTGGSGPRLATSTTTAGAPGYLTSQTLTSEWTTVCDLGTLAHAGAYRVIARVAATASVYSTVAGEYTAARLVVGSGDGANKVRLDTVFPDFNGDIGLIDFGQVQIPVAREGSQRWTAHIESKSSSSNAPKLQVYEVHLMPLERGSADVRIVDSVNGQVVGKDTCDQTSGNLHGKATSFGPAYATSGDTGDFTVNATDHVIQRTQVSDAGDGRFAVIGSTDYTEIDIAADLKVGSTAAQRGVFARYASASAFVRAYFESNNLVRLALYYSGVLFDMETYISSAAYGSGTTHNLRLVITGAGVAKVYANNTLVISRYQDDLIAGGALGTGKFGIWDRQTSGGANTRTVDNIIAYTYSSAQAALFTGRRAVFYPDARVLREASAGSIFSTPNTHIVTRAPELLPAGIEGLSNRIAVLHSRNNPDEAKDVRTEALEADIYYNPVYDLGNWTP